MIKAILFDFDGTLADTVPMMIDSVEELSNRFNLPNVKYKKSLRDKDAKEIIKELKLPLLKIPRFLREAREILKPKLKKARLFTGISGVLKELSKNYQIYIVTTNSREIVETVLGKSKQYIDLISSESSIFGKAAKIKNLLKKTGLRKDEAMYVGDEIRDIEASKKLNIKNIAVTWGFNSKKALKQKYPNFLAEKPSDLLKIIKKV